MTTDSKSKKVKTPKSSSQFVTISLLGLLVVVGILFYMVVDLSNALFELRKDFASKDMSSETSKEEIKNLVLFIEHESRYGKVYEKLVNNIATKGKSITEGMKAPTDYLCGNDKLATILKFHPAGFLMLWSETQVDVNIVRDATKAETAYYYIDGKKMHLLLFDEGKTILQEAKDIKTDKYNVIRSFSLGNVKVSFENCPEELYP